MDVHNFLSLVVSESLLTSEIQPFRPMTKQISRLLSIIAATVWISLSEFLRNEVLFKDKWNRHYEGLGLEFPSEPLNGALWVLWSLLMAIFLSGLLRFMPLRLTIFWGWWASFLMMWLVVGNLAVLPLSILWVAVPWSAVEVGVAVGMLYYLRKEKEE